MHYAASNCTQAKRSNLRASRQSKSRHRAKLQARTHRQSAAGISDVQQLLQWPVGGARTHAAPKRHAARVKGQIERLCLRAPFECAAWYRTSLRVVHVCNRRYRMHSSRRKQLCVYTHTRVYSRVGTAVIHGTLHTCQESKGTSGLPCACMSTMR